MTGPQSLAAAKEILNSEFGQRHPAGYAAIIDRHMAEVFAENERLEIVEQTAGELCDKCHWRMKFPDEPCRCELLAENERLRKALEQVGHAPTPAIATDIAREALAKGATDE